MIPNSVTTIENGAFKNCTNLKEITSLAVTPPSIYDDTFEGVSKTESVVKVPDESVAAYQAADYWKEFINIVGLNDDGGNTEPETKQCAAPTIEFVDGKIIATTTTEGATCYTSITTEDYKGHNGNEAIELTGIYNVSSYAYATGYLKSETVTKQFNIMGDVVTDTVEVHDTVFVDKLVEIEVPVIEYVEIHDTTNIEVHDTVFVDKLVEVEVPVVEYVEVKDTIYIYDDSYTDINLADGSTCTLRVVNGVIYIENAPLYESIVVFSIDGQLQKNMTITEYCTELKLKRNNIYIIYVGETKFKIKI